jgi:hypothetical protein
VAQTSAQTWHHCTFIKGWYWHQAAHFSEVSTGQSENQRPYSKMTKCSNGESNVAALQQNLWLQCGASLRRSIFVSGSHLGTANVRQHNYLVVLAHHPGKTIEATPVTLNNVQQPFTKPGNICSPSM